ncbi:VWA domain-containing protein [Cytobacillus sp. FJAT-53684]|uniref:VWA domain-containing protein n=1 Tax=Cytobacillus mangrovibacter TaxID=3299024 RepID=A0ABW6JYA9_9BACI
MKNKRKWFISFLALHFILLLSFSSLTVSANGIDTPSIDYTVKPSQNEIVKPQNSNAEGSLDFHLTPSGKTTNEYRDPIDVVFIFDKSGSMKDSGKMDSAKKAMIEAVDFFKENAGPKDNFAFIPFASDVEKEVGYSPLDIKGGLDKIKERANGLQPNGGTNYTQSFEKALEILQNEKPKVEKENNKYIIFMTDGEPTVSKNDEVLTFNKKLCIWNCKVTKEVNVEYQLLGSKPYSGYNATFSYSLFSYDKENFGKDDTIKAIKQHGEDRAQLLAEQDVKLFSIGFGNKNDVDMEYLRKLSSITGATARQASQDNITSIFREISEDVGTPSITAEIKVDLSKFNGKVKLVENPTATEKNNIVTMKYNFKFPFNQNASQPVDLSLPFSFSEIGTYTFDDITMTYTDLKGEFKEKKHGPVTIEVKKDAAPTFQGTMGLEGITNTPDNLIKVSGSTEQSNQFKVNYTLTPFGLVDNKVIGKLTDIKIIQPLPDGVSIVPANGVSSVTTPDGKKGAQINIAQVVNYSNGKFDPTQLAATFQLKGEWALSNVKMPLATVQYTDSRFGNQTSSIAASNQSINLKVRLKEFPNNAYDGDASGLITKVDLNQNGAKIGQTEFPNDYGLKNKAIKDMTFSGEKSTAIEVTYFDNEKAMIYLQPDFEMIGMKTGDKYNSGDKAVETIQVKLSNLVAGKGVKYYYSIQNEKQNVSWTEFNPSQLIGVTTSGLNTIKVKAVGGFAIDKIEITKTIIIEKPIEKVTINPNPIEVEVDKTKSFEIEINPVEATNTKLEISIENRNKAELIDDKTILGKSDGETYLIVKTTDGSNIEVKVKVIVKDPYISLKEIKFNKPVYKIEKGERLAVKDLLIFNPIKATKRELDSVKSSMPAQVGIVNDNGEWFIVGKDIGYSTITVQAEEQKDKTKPKASALFEIVNKNEGNNSGPPGGGRW